MKKIATAIAIIAGACGTAAHANDNVTFTGFAHGSETVTYNLLNTAALADPSNAITGAANAGGFATSLNGGPSFVSYCVDLYQTISFGTTYTDYTANPAHTFRNTNALSDLSRLYSYVGSTIGPINTSMLESAFQIAVWEIAYETSGTYALDGGLGGTATFVGGTAQSSGALMSASNWLAALANVASGPAIGVLDSGRNQDIIYAPVPEPSTVMLMLSGLVGVAALSRRRKSGKRSA